MVQDNVIDYTDSEACATWKSMQKLVELERNMLRYLINIRYVSIWTVPVQVFSLTFMHYSIEDNAFGIRYELGEEDPPIQSDGDKLELVVMEIYREPEG